MMGTETRLLLKDDGEHQLPLDWQQRFEWIVSRLVEGDFNFSSDILDVESVSLAEQGRFAENIRAYGDRLVSLNRAVWQSSIYAWAKDHWLVLVDLSTEKEPVSDLVLHARIWDGEPPRVSLDSIHVP